MDYKKIKASTEAITRDITHFDELSGNIYETITILSKRSNQISMALRQELLQKISEFSAVTYNADSMDEIFENREQIEIARFYEQLPKSTLMAIQEMLDGNLAFKRPEIEKD
ncbi:MAG: RNA polymerase Rpb6 [Bacteroidales bacterium]